MENHPDPHQHKATVFNAARSSTKTVLVAVALVAAIVFFGGITYYLRHHTVGDASVGELDAAKVEITSQGFNPATVKLKRGQQLTWTNADATPHQVSGTDKSIEELQTDTSINPESSHTATMEHSGTFTYYDSLNNTDFKGTIIVE
jgi:plastocyanin